MKDKLIEVLSIQTESYKQHRMFAYLIRQLKRMDCKYYTYNGCIYVSKGKANFYPCIVAHMDTVHDIVEDLTVIEVKGNLTGFNAVKMQQTGIGGDDKVGVFIALQCLEYFDNIKAVFFRDEEVGCDGSYDPDKEFFTDCGFILQCDRRGNRDFITNASGIELSCKGFQSDIKHIIKSYSYKFRYGMMTDVMALKESGIDCSMANISCGYYNPHDYNEYVNIKDVHRCLSLVKDIISSIGGNRYECKYIMPDRYASVIKYDKYTDNDRYEDYFKSVPVYKKSVLCECCYEEADKLKYISDYNIEMCDNCIKAYIVST